MPSKLEQAVTYWVKAEYAFRLGPHAYTDATTHLYVQAEQRLRRALVKHGSLHVAARRVGVPMHTPTTRSKRPARKKKTGRKRITSPQLKF